MLQSRSVLVLLGLLGTARAQCTTSGLALPLYGESYQIDADTPCSNGVIIADGEVCTLVCAAGYAPTGVEASCSSGTFTPGGQTCIDVDECSDPALSNCAAVGSSCTNLEGTHLCTCDAGYTGSGAECTENSCVVGSGYPAGVGVEIERDSCAEQDMTGLEPVADAAACNALSACTFTCTGTATPECTGNANDASSYPDCEAAFAATGECPVGCDGTPTCDVDPNTASSQGGGDTRADDVCPAGCTETCEPTVPDGALGTVTSLGVVSCESSYEACTGTPNPAIAGHATCESFTAAFPDEACPPGCAVPTAQCLVPDAAFTFNGCLENTCTVNTDAMAAAFIVPESNAWEADGKVSSMGRLTCAPGYHGVAQAECPDESGQIAFSGCVENECLAGSGNPGTSWVVVPAGVADEVTVSGLVGLSCVGGYSGAATVTCVDHGGVFSFTGCEENTCTPSAQVFADAHVDVTDPTATTVSGLGSVTCAAGYHSACTGTLDTPVDDGQGGTTTSCSTVLANTYSCPDGCTGLTPLCSLNGDFLFSPGCEENRCTAPGDGTGNGGVETNGVRVTNSGEVVVGEEVATSGTPDGVSDIDGLGLGAACVAPQDSGLSCADNADWISAGTEASCPVGCDFYSACLGAGWDGDFRSEGWTGGDGLGVTTAICEVDGGVFAFSGCTDLDDCATENDNGGCGEDATCANIPGSRTCTCNTAEQVPGTTGYVGNCPIGEHYCKTDTPYCRVVPDGGDGSDALTETACEIINADEGTQANQWTDNLHLDETACSGTGTWTLCTSHTPTMCFAQLPQHCEGAFEEFGPCLDSLGAEHPCECPSGDCTHTKTYQITLPALNAAQRYDSDESSFPAPVPTQVQQGTPAAAASCPRLEPTCTPNDNTPGDVDCEQVFAYALGTTVFNNGAVLSHTAPQDDDCPAECDYAPIAADGVDEAYLLRPYVVETSCSEYVNNVPRSNTYIPSYCEITATDATVCANGQYTFWDEFASICIRTIATSKETCEEFPHPEVSDCAAVAMGISAVTAQASCIEVPGCVYEPNDTDPSAPGECTPVGGSTWAPNQCLDFSGLIDVCDVTMTGGAENAAANRLTCETEPGCVYSPDDAGTPENEETCLIRDRDACEFELLSIQNGQQTVSGKGLFAYGAASGIDVGDTISVIQVLGSDPVGETRQIVSVFSSDMATVSGPWQIETGGVAIPVKFSTGTGACPGRMKQNKLEHDMHTLSASLLAANSATRDDVSQQIQANRASNLAAATQVQTNLNTKMATMQQEQLDRQSDRDIVEAALVQMATDVGAAHSAALSAATTALTETQNRIDLANGALDAEADRVHTLMAHQLEQHNTDTAMLSDQRTLFKEAFDAQATLLANSVGSASVASEVTASRTYIDDIQGAAGYDTRIDPVPACAAANADDATCHAAAGCAWDGVDTCTPLVVACPEAIPTGAAATQSTADACAAVGPADSCTYAVVEGVPSCTYEGDYQSGSGR